MENQGKNSGKIPVKKIIKQTYQVEVERY